MATTDDGRRVEAALAGDPGAFGQLFDGWFDRVHDLSRRIVRDPEIAAEVAQDAFLAAWTGLATLDDVDAFGGWLLRIARNRSLNRLEREQRSIALDDDTMTTLTDLDPHDPDPLRRLDRAEQIDLVWDAAAALGPRDRSVLDLHLRHGLGAAELAEELETTANNAHQILHVLRGRLATNVRALVLWRGGRPACEPLRAVLVAARADSFDKATVKLIDRHAEACDDCARDRTARLSPAALFAAAPVVAAPAAARAEVAAALGRAGVPVGGAGSAGGAGEVPDRGTPSTERSIASTQPATGGAAEPVDRTESVDRAEDDDGREAMASRRRVPVLAAIALLLLGATAAWVVADASGDQAPPLPTVEDPTTVPPTSTTTSTTAPATTATSVPPDTAPRSGSSVPAPPVVADPPPPGPSPSTTVPDRRPDPTTTTTTVPETIPPGAGTTTTTTTPGGIVPGGPGEITIGPGPPIPG